MTGKFIFFPLGEHTIQLHKQLILFLPVYKNPNEFWLLHLVGDEKLSLIALWNLSEFNAHTYLEATETVALTHARRNDNLNVAIVALNHFIFRQLAARQIIFVKIDLQARLSFSGMWIAERADTRIKRNVIKKSNTRRNCLIIFITDCAFPKSSNQ